MSQAETGEAGHQHQTFDATRVFVGLIVFTALEVAWGHYGHQWGWGHLLLWGGLIVWALCKGFLIASYFMHLRFEGWIVKGLIAPTPILVIVILAALTPDIGSPDETKLVNSIGSMYDPATGAIEDLKHKEHGHDQAEPGASQPGGEHGATPAPAPAH